MITWGLKNCLIEIAPNLGGSCATIGVTLVGFLVGIPSISNVIIIIKIIIPLLNSFLFELSQYSMSGLCSKDDC